MNEDILIPLAAFAIPIVAITGGIIMGIVRALGRQRMMELAQRERIAAIERGVDPAKLPVLDLSHFDGHDGFNGFDRPSSPMRRAQGLLIGGLVTLFAGVGVTLFLGLITHDHSGDERYVWAVGLIPAFVGLALLLSARIVWPRGGNPAS
jgi:hypothetical protein